MILPMSLSMYQIANLYCRIQQDHELRREGDMVELIHSQDYDNGRERGQYTYKVYQSKSHLTGFLKWALPSRQFRLHEKQYNLFPHICSFYEIPELGRGFSLTIESHHFRYDGTIPNENIFDLSDDELGQRQIIYLDILSDSVGNQSCVPAWATNLDKEMMICIKLVKFDFPWKGLQGAVEKYMINTVLRESVVRTHRQMINSADCWSKMALEEVQLEEKQVLKNQNWHVP